MTSERNVAFGRALRIAVVLAVLAGLTALPGIAAEAATTEDPDLTVTKAGFGIGTVTSNPAGINCGTDCEHAYPGDSEQVCAYDPDVGRVICTEQWISQDVTLTASAASGSTFTGWSGGGCSGTGTCVVTMDEDKTVTATFADTQRPLVTSISPTSGAHKSSITATATATDNVGLKYVYFQVWQDDGERFAGGYYDYSAPYQFYLGDLDHTDLVDGPVRLNVGARDTSDNWSLYSPAAISHFTIDDTAPALEITSGPTAGSASPDKYDVTFEFSASDASWSSSDDADVTCALTKGSGIVRDFEPCDGSGYVAANSDGSGLTPGTYTFRVRARDQAGNATTAERTWTVTRMPTGMSLTTSKTQRNVVGKGFLRENWEDDTDKRLSGATVVVTLFKKKSGRFVKLSSKSPVTDSSGNYTAKFSRPKVGTCKISSTYAGTDTHLGTKTVRKFAC